MEMRRRPVKIFEWLIARGYAKKGDRFQPTGMYRDALLKQGAIREVTEEEISRENAAKRAMSELNDRMIPEPVHEFPLNTRKVKHGHRH